MAKKLSKFEAAFAEARKGGKKEFDFGGKKFNTKMKGEGASKGKSSLPKTAPTPMARPKTEVKTAKRRDALNPSRDRAASLNRSEISYKRSPSFRTSGKSSSTSKPFMSNSETLNTFKQKESRRSADSSTKNVVKSSLTAAGKSLLKRKYK